MNAPVPRFERLLAVVVLCIASAAHGDLLALHDQENLSGTLVSVSDGTLVFRTAYAGLLVVPVSEVAALQTKERRSVRMVDGAEFTGRFITEEGRVQLTRGPSGTVPAPLSRIASVSAATPEREKAPEEATKPAQPDSDEFSVSTGVLRRWSDDDRTEPFARLRVREVSEDFYLAATGLLSLGGGDEFPRYADVVADFRGRRGDNVFPMVIAGFQRDAGRGLAVRGEAGAGLARVSAVGGGELEVAAALGASGSRYDADMLTDGSDTLGDLADWHYYRLHDQRADRSDIELMLRLRHQQPLFERLELRNDLRLYPSLTHAGRLRGRLESRLRWLLNPRLSVDVELLVDYVGDPPLRDVSEWSTSVGAGLRWGF